MTLSQSGLLELTQVLRTADGGDVMRQMLGYMLQRLSMPRRPAWSVLPRPDYNSESGRSVRIIGFSVTADDVITLIVLEKDGTEFGVNEWAANQRDRRYYADQERGSGR